MTHARLSQIVAILCDQCYARDVDGLIAMAKKLDAHCTREEIEEVCKLLMFQMAGAEPIPKLEDILK